MTKKIILLDFDGGLANTWQVLASLLLQISKEQGFNHSLNLNQAISLAQNHQSMVVTTWQLMNIMKIPLLKRIKILKLVNFEFNRLVKVQTHYQHISWELFPDVQATIKQLFNQGYQLGVVSEHKLSRLTQFLAEREILKYFNLGVFSSKQKIKILRKIAKKYPNQKIYYLADKVQDIFDAKKAGIIPISLITGLSSKQDLEKVNRGKVIDSLNHDIFKMMK